MLFFYEARRKGGILMLSKHIQENSKRTAVTDSYTFEYLIEKNLLYVDKTEYLYKLIASNKKLFFFSRPRRFGKSLTLSTLKAIFQGKKELFKDLYIEEQPYDWKTYPGIHIDMGSNASDTPDKLEEELISNINSSAYEHKIELIEKSYNKRFEELIKKLYERDGNVVILIDEYDKPILNNIEKENITDFQAKMKGFYSVLKTCEPYERFVFITGVGKFLKVSIFSDLNNLNDISMSDDYAAMCGYTEKELKDNFPTQLKEASKQYDFDYETFLQKVKEWYDGYRFSRKSENVYNPVSLAKFLENHGDFSNYWFETGSPSIIIKKINKTASFSIEKLLKETHPADIFTAFAPAEFSIIALMYQTGYLTIKDTEKIGLETFYRIGFPNYEVKQSFYRRLISSFNNENYIGDSLYLNLIKAIKSNDIDKMMSVIDSYLAGIPNNIQIENEKYFQTVFFCIFSLIGASISAEVCTSDGRIDAVIDNCDNVYIFEFKLNKSGRIAMKQIMQKEYYKKYEHSEKKITLVGANFSFETRRLSKWTIKKL